MGGLSPTMRTLRELRNLNRKCDIVERFIHNTKVNPCGGIRSDLFGFIDIIAIEPDKGVIIGVQSCGNSFAAHYRKIIRDRTENAIAWLRSGGKIELWAWSKVKAKPGGRRLVWRPRVQEITLKDFGRDLSSGKGHQQELFSAYRIQICKTEKSVQPGLSDSK